MLRTGQAVSRGWEMQGKDADRAEFIHPSTEAKLTEFKGMKSKLKANFCDTE